MTALGTAAVFGGGVEKVAAVAITEHSAGLGSGHWPGFITPGPDGNPWFTFWSCGRGTGTCGLGRVNPDLTITEFTAGLPSDTFPTAITAGADGMLWFLDAPESATPPAVRTISPTGTITEVPSAIEGGNIPSDIATGPDGNVWFTSQGTSPEITRLTPGGGVTHFSAPSTVLPSDGTLRSITPGHDNSLWFTDPGASPRIGRITTSGAITVFPLASSSSPADIVAGPDGNVWFTNESATPAIVRMTPTGVTTPFSNGLSPGATPDAITVGPDGNLWFTELGSHARIGRITPAGQITEFSAGLAADSVLHDITAGQDGTLWFTDQGCNGRPGGTCAIGRLALELAPSVLTGEATSITRTSALVAGAVNPLGGAVRQIVVRYRVGTGPDRTVTATPGSLPAAGAASSISARLTGLPPGQTVSYQVLATNAYGTTTGQSRRFRTLGGPPPTITNLTQSHRRWRRGSSLASLSRRRTRPPVGTTFSFRLNEAAALQVQFTRVRTGRVVGGRCVAVARGNRRRARCTRLLAAGTLRFSGHPARNRIRFAGRLSARRSLGVGTYQVRIVATAFGSSRHTRALTFQVVAR